MAKPLSRRPSKIYKVALGQMRVPPALITQREFRKAHGDRLTAELDLNKLGFPIINHRDEVFWVLDGQHRIYALKQFGFCDKDLFECEVYEDLTDPEMAEIFLGRDARRAISPFDKFHVACTAGRRRETGIRRAVEAQGLKISRTKEEGCIGAIAALGRVYDRGGAPDKGEVLVGQVVRTITKSFGGDPNAFDGGVIEGFGHVFARYNGATDERRIAEQLSKIQHGVGGLLRRSEAQRERTGNQKAQCVAATIVDLYNKGLGPRSANRLPPWWKEA